MAPRYQEASRAQKIVLLDQFVALTGYVRKYAIQLLNHPEEPKPRSQQARLPHYGLEVQQALLLAWKAGNQICAKRLIPFLPTLRLPNWTSTRCMPHLPGFTPLTLS
jgi:hypothetical protein